MPSDMTVTLFSVIICASVHEKHNVGIGMGLERPQDRKQRILHKSRCTFMVYEHYLVFQESPCADVRGRLLLKVQV